ncbi:MAG: selenocysteine-specific translation elongation factor [Actinobacteria bacterium]|nr:selenocysteine-specific translation elongation factor [Actinomycetota bacterium]
MKGIIIGTAGHVDHGKTMLVKALTGLDTDRLKEERERGISIELGFAFLDLPGGKRAGIVDVPGHERFIKNMLAGVGGIDMVILVIASDEGVMPQTREHLDIIQLLQVKHGVVALTKTDAVDSDWIALVKEEVRDFLKGTVLEGAPLIEVSSVTGGGIETLKNTLAEMAGRVEKMVADGPLRLPVDRVFSVTGFGTVVTGTIISGSAGTGDPVEILPRGISSRIRNIHVHGHKVDRVGAGQRAALNITGVEVEQIHRGSVVAAPGHLKPTYRMDVRLQLLGSARALKNRARVRLYLGTAEIFGRVILLQEDGLDPGKWAYAQLELEEKAVAAKGDRFVIRSYSPMRTIGGGSVIDTVPQKHKRFKKDIIESIATREKGTPGELVQQALGGRRDMTPAGDIARAAGVSEDEAGKALGELESQGAVRRIEGEGQVYYLSAGQYQKWSDETRALLQKYHRQFPLREGFPKEELRSRKFGGLNAKQFQLLLHSLESDGIVAAGTATVADPGYVFEPGPELKKKIISLESKYTNSAMQPPSWKEAAAGHGLDEGLAAEVLRLLVRKGALVKVAEDIYCHSSSLEEAKKRLAGFFHSRGEITVGEFRDLLNTSRKYALPLLEYFDREKVTRRVGDVRVPGREMKG